MATVKRKKRSTHAPKGTYVTSTPVTLPFSDDEEFAQVLKTARYNAAEVRKLQKDERANQGRIRRHQEDTLIAIRDFANKRNLSPEKVAAQITKAMLP